MYAAFSSELFANWTVAGNGLPNAPVYDLEYDGNEDLVLAGLLGRGAWTLTPTTPSVFEEVFFMDGFEDAAP